MQKNILVTGGAGFIGSHLVRHFVNKYSKYHIINLDILSYAGNLENLTDLQNKPNYTFVKGDILDAVLVEKLFVKYNIDSVIHLAAESHVDRSITNPMKFLETNILGTATLLNIAKSSWKNKKNVLFYNVSTDEVYGSLGDTGLFSETTSYDPRSPYSASKASGDHLVRAYYHTFDLPILISNCSNNYGPNQFPEKLIPLVINNIKHNRPLPIYGDGTNVRDWLYVTDHVEAIDRIFHNGNIGETYNIGGDNELENISIVKTLCKVVDDQLGRKKGSAEKLITYVKDRPGHDQRYAIDANKIKNNLDWFPRTDFDSGIKQTVEWYLQHNSWLEHVTSGTYQEYYDKHYK